MNADALLHLLCASIHKVFAKRRNVFQVAEKQVLIDDFMQHLNCRYLAEPCPYTRVLVPLLRPRPPYRTLQPWAV